jgi:hypothetical protein
MVFGAKYLPMFERPADVNYTVLELDRINDIQQVDLPPADELPEMTLNTALTAKL